MIDNKIKNIFFGYKLNIITLILLIISIFVRNTFVSAALYNYFVILAALYFIDGVAVLNHFLNKKIKRPMTAAITTWAIVFLGFITIFAMPAVNGITILFFLGMMDSTRNFRKIRGAK